MAPSPTRETMPSVITIPAAADPNEGLTMANLREHLHRKLILPHNASFVGERKPEDLAAREALLVRSGYFDTPVPETLKGPITLLRGVSDPNPAPGKRQNNPFGGWWFPEQLLLKFYEQFERIPISDRLERSAVRGHLRAALALAPVWNEFEELWCMQLEPGQPLTGLAGIACEQFLNPDHAGLGKLLGGAKQYYFPVIPPFCVKPYPYRLI
jgi:hypothetical protein